LQQVDMYDVSGVTTQWIV